MSYYDPVTHQIVSDTPKTTSPTTQATSTTSPLPALQPEPMPAVTVAPTTTKTPSTTSPTTTSPAPSTAIQSTAPSLSYYQQQGYITMGADGPTWTGPQYVQDGNQMVAGTTLLQRYMPQMLYPDYFNADGTQKYTAPTTISGSGQPGAPSISGTRNSPETTPWLYPQGQDGGWASDPLSGNDYANSVWPEGVGFPTIPEMTWEQRVAAANSQNYYQTGEGVDPALLDGMSRTNPTTGNQNSPDVYTNQYGTYTTPYWYTDPDTKETTYYGATFVGVDQQGNPIDYTAPIPWGSQSTAALSGDPWTLDANGQWVPSGGGGAPDSGGSFGGLTGGGVPAAGGGAGTTTGGGTPGGVPGLMDYFGQGQDYYGRAFTIGADGRPIPVQVTTRTPGQEELSGYQLDQLLDPDSPLAKRSIQFGIDQGAGRGLMNSSIAGGNAYGAWIDRVQPYALDQAATYGRAASENMAATNAGAQQDAANAQQLRMERDSALRNYLLGTATDYTRAGLNVENREDIQSNDALQADLARRWQTGERIGGQKFQTGERIGGQQWQSGERATDRTFTTSEREGSQEFSSAEQMAIRAFERGERIDTQAFTNEQRQAVEAFQWRRDQLDAQLTRAGIDQNDRSIWLQAWTNLQLGLAGSIGQAGAQIYANTDLTPAQQNAAVQNMIAFFSSQYPSAPPYGVTPPAAPASNTSGLSYDAAGKPIFSIGLT